MSYRIKREHLKNWDLQQSNGKPRIHMASGENDDDDDDQDLYISERSSITSSSDTSQILSPAAKRLPTPSLSSRLSPLRKTPHTLRYAYNKTPENGVPVAVQYQFQRKDDKKKKNLRKAPPGQGKLVPLPQVKPPDSGDNYYPYWYYYKLKNPDWIMHQQRTADGQIIPYDSFDPSKYAPQLTVTTSSIKPKKRTRKSHHNDVSIITRSNRDKQRQDYSEKNPSTSSHLIVHENNHSQQLQPLPKYTVPLKDVNNNEYREQQTKETISQQQQRRKLKTENEWTDHYMKSVSTKPLQKINNFILTPNSLAHRSKLPDKHSVIAFTDENSKPRCNHQSRPHNSSSQQHHNHTHLYNSPSIPSQQTHHHRHQPKKTYLQHPFFSPSEKNHHYHYQTPTHVNNTSHVVPQPNYYPDYHQQHLHIRRRPSSGAYTDSDVQVVDILFKDSAQAEYHPPASLFQNQTSYLPSIMQDHHHKTTAVRFSSEHESTFGRQTHSKSSQQSTGKTSVHKPILRTRFCDHHLYNLANKRLAT